MDSKPNAERNDLELRDRCPKSQRKRHSLRHTIQFPVRCRSTATECQRDRRLFQDRIAHDCWDPGTWRRWHPYADTDGNGYCDCDLHAYCYCDPDGYCDCHLYAYCYSDACSNFNPEA